MEELAHEPTSILKAYSEAQMTEKKLTLTIPSYGANLQPRLQLASNYNNQPASIFASRPPPRPFHSGSATSGANKAPTNARPAASFSSSTPSKAMRTFTTSQVKEGRKGSAFTVTKSGGRGTNAKLNRTW